jgi:hypothetical protein
VDATEEEKKELFRYYHYALSRADMQVVDKAPNVLRVEPFKATGQPRKYILSTDKQTVTLAASGRGWHASLLAAGKVVWTSRGTKQDPSTWVATIDTPQPLTVPPGQSPQQLIDTSYCRMLLQMLPRPSGYIYRTTPPISALRPDGTFSPVSEKEWDAKP